MSFPEKIRNIFQVEIDKATQDGDVATKVILSAIQRDVLALCEKELVERKQKLRELFASLPINYYLGKGVFEIYGLGTKKELEEWLKKFDGLLKQT